MSFSDSFNMLRRKCMFLPDGASVSVKITNPGVFVQAFIEVWFSSFKLNTITLENVENPLKTSKH